MCNFLGASTIKVNNSAVTNKHTDGYLCKNFTLKKKGVGDGGVRAYSSMGAYRSNTVYDKTRSNHRLVKCVRLVHLRGPS